MTMFNTVKPYEAILLVLAPEKGENRFPVHLMDSFGHEDSGYFQLDLKRDCGGLGGLKWDDFLARYRELDVTDDEINGFSVDFFRALIYESGLLSCWSAIQAAAGIAPLSLTVELSEGTEAFAALPLELLQDKENFIFRRPESGIQRALLNTPARPFVSRTDPRVLMAWACPPHSGYPFDPSLHVAALSDVFGDRLVVLPEAGRNSILAALLDAEKGGDPFDYFLLLAHGYKDELTGASVCTALKDLWST